MLTLSCPSCGASVPFRSKASLFAVCSYCQSTLVRHDQDLSLIGKMAELQDELSPLQVGTKGEYGGKTFEIIGRIKVGYSDGLWNEWYAYFPDGKEGWLAEAQGFWAMCFAVTGKNTADVPDKVNLQPGLIVNLPPFGRFQIEDIRDVVCRYSEGELPMSAAQGRRSKSVDLTGPDEQMATIEYAEDSVRVFVGAYEDFDSFKFQNLRELDGWS